MLLGQMIVYTLSGNLFCRKIWRASRQRRTEEGGAADGCYYFQFCIDWLGIFTELKANW